MTDYPYPYPAPRVVPPGRRAARGIRGATGHRTWVDDMEAMDQPPERVIEHAGFDEMMARVRMAARIPDEPPPPYSWDRPDSERRRVDWRAAARAAYARAVSPLHLPSEPHPFGGVDFDRLVAPHLTEALELLADARLAASDAGRSAARAGRLAVEAVEALVGR